MSITVVIARDDVGAPSTKEVYESGAKFTVEGGDLSIISGKPQLIALYGSGNWQSVHVDDHVQVIVEKREEDDDDASSDFSFGDDDETSDSTSSDDPFADLGLGDDASSDTSTDSTDDDPFAGLGLDDDTSDSEASTSS